MLRPRTRQDGEVFLCSDSQTHLFGVGPTKETVREEYLQALRDMYESLKEEDRPLHLCLLPQHNLLRSVFEPGDGE